MSQFRLARISLILAALGLNAAPALLTSAHAQEKPAAAAGAAKQETVRPEMFKLLDPNKVKEMMTAKKYAEVQANITAAEAFPNRTPYETYIIERMKLALGVSTNNDKMTMGALEQVINSGRLEKNEQSDFVLTLGNYYFNAKDYPKAVEWMKRYQAESTTPERVRSSLARAHYLNNDFAASKTEIEKAIAEAEKTGKPATKEDLGLLVNNAVKLKDMTTYNATMEKLVASYPTEEYWNDLLHRMQNKTTFNDRLRLDAFRLQSVALKELAAEEYVEMTERALLAGFFTEAKNTMEAGYAKGVLGKGNKAGEHKQLRDKAARGAADDAKTIDAGEAGALKAKTGLPMVNLGYAYVTMDKFDKGIELMEKGIAKGGLKNPEDAKLRLGVAYFKAGRKAEATKVFESIKGNDGSGDLARYWIMYMNPPAASAAAPVAPVK